MRVQTHGSLAVQLIRQLRFGSDCPQLSAACHPLGHRLQPRVCQSLQPIAAQHKHAGPVDRVELSRQALASDPWALDCCRAAHARLGLDACDSATGGEAPAPRVMLPARTITPVVGSSALAGLGVSLVVPGTLLDVVA